MFYPLLLSVSLHRRSYESDLRGGRFLWLSRTNEQGSFHCILVRTYRRRAHIQRRRKNNANSMHMEYVLRASNSRCSVDRLLWRRTRYGRILYRFVTIIIIFVAETFVYNIIYYNLFCAHKFNKLRRLNDVDRSLFVFILFRSVTIILLYIIINVPGAFISIFLFTVYVTSSWTMVVWELKQKWTEFRRITAWRPRK